MPFMPTPEQADNRSASQRPTITRSKWLRLGVFVLPLVLTAKTPFTLADEPGYQPVRVISFQPPIAEVQTKRVGSLTGLARILADIPTRQIRPPN